MNIQTMDKHSLTEIIEKNKETPSQQLLDEAVKVREKHYGRKVFVRGLIEFTNYCKNDCYYCGIRCGNKNAHRYRLTEEQILNCADEGHRLGFNT
ncbi:MAG: [FeFe] hydrogenase H-cluster radical SAM maturase HydE, partial [Clostridia bacterium]|nr:[FeFe] hydrogenase H-cluster radical SAM maturase HydE [Clostridia bacterium]